MNDCIFCKIINKEIPASIVYEDDICIAFLDLTQTTDGHTLVIPKQHATHFLEVPVETLQHMSVVTQTLANRITTNLGASGCNILTNAGIDAGQTVMHFHMHIIPRYPNESTLSITFTDRSQEVQLDSILEKINT